MKPRFGLCLGGLCLGGLLVFAQSAALEVEVAAEPHHHLIIENQSVRVYYVEVPAHSDTLMHWHRHDYFYVSLGPADIINAVKDKPPVSRKLQDGEIGFAAATFAHVARNLSDQLFRNVTVEVLEDETLRNSTAKWDEERGLDVLQNGTKEILFVKDGIRATEFELQPGGIVPMHHYTGPHLFIAVSDLDIGSDVPGQSPMPGHFKSGEAQWLPGGYAHTITNTGKQPAKFVTLEWP